VNVITTSTPFIHNDEAIIASLENRGFAPEDARDRARPAASSRRAAAPFGHTNCMP
jgi:hypothetical protein